MTATELAARWLDVASGRDRDVRNRLERGRAGAGRLTDVLQPVPGGLEVRVPDGRGRSHDVSLAIAPIDDEAWAEVLERVGDQVRNTADLLEGRLPDVLLADDLLMPDEVTARCTCTEPRPCRHEAAAHHAVATGLFRDPTRLLRYRGRSVDELLATLRRSGQSAEVTPDELVEEIDPFVAGGDLDSIDVHPVVQPDIAAVFERLGPPPGVDETERLEALMHEAAALAWRLAAGEGSEVADDEALLTELRAQGVATATSIASSLGMDPTPAQEALDRLYSEGTVMRMGQGDTARYRAS